MAEFFISDKPSIRQWREALAARRNRLEIQAALSHGKVSRRELVKMGVFTGAGLLSCKQGLSPFVGSAYGAIPTGVPKSPMFGVLPFSQPMPRFDVLQRKPMAELTPSPMKEANTTQQALNPALPGVRAGDTGPVEGRPPGANWAHQEFDAEYFAPQVAYEVYQKGNQGPNTTYNPQVPSSLNSGIDPAQAIPLRFHAGLPVQPENSVWTFNGTVPPKLLLGRYGEAILFRHHNRLPWDVTKNGGFGRHTISTHEHNGHHGAENDGFTGAFFYPGQFYDYHYPICHAGWRTINAEATDPVGSSRVDLQACKLEYSIVSPK